ncbi:hypothetical protein ASB57_27030 [Bordetella sp. N]|nr:hypothetical protein ASB57_27030 [Bordetella sp. N]
MAATAVSVVALLGACATHSGPDTSATRFKVDAAWPQALPDQEILGQVAGVATSTDDHVWVLQRPGSLTEDERGAALNPPLSSCCKPAPPVIEFDAAGKPLRAWGGPGQGYDWPQNEHSIYVDKQGYVWISGNGDKDGQILKFTRDGKFVLQIGKPGPQTGNRDTTRLGRPAGVEVDTDARELYVADGYYNRRVIVFDSDTGAYKRMWGGYGKQPADIGPASSVRRDPPTPEQLLQFSNPHCVRVARDGMVYVCDRLNNRIQVFQKDGAYVKEFSVAPNTAGPGSVWDLVLSRDPAQEYLYVADGRNNQLLTLSRDTGQVLATTGHSGRYAGDFHWVHDLAIDSQGNLYTGDVDTGKRVQKFTPTR